ncbi:hypothetical protein PO883_34325 [Massilia sp. DJPM01]|uniref:hypothetical protein n=1 Tax=Massilia sp. DJPM01 TaxID=3024404 RepID=UPI00259FAA8D|nr:hypothetical protein [Massilia sp. DJPM01]MDM5182246.1 hypothetical protein [Massilia sp. DJPM01]
MLFLEFSLVLLSNVCIAGEGGVAPDRLIETSTGVIFSKEVAVAKRVCASLRDCWNPSGQEIEILEKDLPRFLSESKIWGSAEISRNLTKYRFKYYGLKKGGARYIHVNGLCQKYWRRESANFDSPNRPMTDMGSCYFLIDYDVVRRKFENYYVDGEA